MKRYLLQSIDYQRMNGYVRGIHTFFFPYEYRDDEKSLLVSSREARICQLVYQLKVYRP